MVVLGEKLLTDYSSKTKELPTRGIVRCTKCGLLSKKTESAKYIQYTHRVFATPIGSNRLEGCTEKKD